MPSAHARLSPSASERWISCPASIRVEEDLKAIGITGSDSIFAQEGTAAHALGELKARHEILREMSTREFNLAYDAWLTEYDEILSQPGVDIVEMEEYTDQYVALIRERLALYPNSVLMLEQRMSTGVPTCWGTSDTVIVSPQHVEIIDFKYGAGIRVEAKGNSQLRLYGVGALDTFGDILGDTEIVRITVHQPRLSHILTEEIHPDELRAWRDGIVPIAETALTDPEAPFGPSDEACRWCSASGRCKAQMEEVFGTDFGVSPDTLSPEQIAEALPKIKLIKDWMSALESAALDTAYAHSTPIPGYKVVISGGIRKVTDDERALAALVEAGYSAEQVGQFKVLGIGKLEKLLKEDFKPLLEETGLVRKSEGRPSLVIDVDDRPSTTPNEEARKEFS